MTDETLRTARALGAATLHEAAGRIGVVRSDIRPVDPAMVLAGPAFPIRTSPGDNLAIHRALYVAQPGDVLVVATGDRHAAWGYWGEILSVAALERHLGGLVLEGGSRDHARLVDLGFPVFSLGACIRGTIKDPDAPIDMPAAEVVIDDLHIATGDLVVGDTDGVVVIPDRLVTDTVAAGEQREAKERTIMAQLRQGQTTLDLLGLHA